MRPTLWFGNELASQSINHIILFLWWSTYVEFHFHWLQIYTQNKEKNSNPKDIQKKVISNDSEYLISSKSNTNS